MTEGAGGRPLGSGSSFVRYGVTTGQAVAPLVVHTMRPWIAGETGVFAAMWSASTSSMMSRLVVRETTTG